MPSTSWAGIPVSRITGRALEAGVVVENDFYGKLYINSYVHVPYFVLLIMFLCENLLLCIHVYILGASHELQLRPIRPGGVSLRYSNGRSSCQGGCGESVQSQSEGGQALAGYRGDRSQDRMCRKLS